MNQRDNKSGGWVPYRRLSAVVGNVSIQGGHIDSHEAMIRR